MARRWRSSPTEQSRQAAACPIPALQIGIGRRRWRGSGIGGVKAPDGERAAGARPSPVRRVASQRRTGDPLLVAGIGGFELLAFGDELLSERVGVPGFVVGIVVAQH